MTTPVSRRDLLRTGGAALAALSVGATAHAQTPKLGGTFVSAQTTEATGLDPQLVPAFSRSRRSPMLYNQLVRLDADMNPVPELAESWRVSTICCSTFQSCKTNGPVPSAALLRSPCFVIPASLMMKPQNPPRAARSPAKGSFVTNLTA